MYGDCIKIAFVYGDCTKIAFVYGDCTKIEFVYVAEMIINRITLFYLMMQHNILPNSNKNC